MKIAFIGHGNVGRAVADSVARRGHPVILAADGDRQVKAEATAAQIPGATVATTEAAVAAADLVVLAVPYGAVEAALTPLREALAGKILIDCTNPVGPGLTHGLGSQRSGTQAIQALVPATPVVKAFSIYGFENFEPEAWAGHDPRPVMMFCGDDRGAKATVGALLAELGWDPLDVGGASAALQLEHMTLLWVRLVRAGGRSSRLVWSRLER